MTLERSVEQSVVAHARKSGLKARKMNGTGHRSWPDYAFWGPGGVHFMIEFKRPGGAPTPKQQALIDDLNRLGTPVHVVDSVATGKAIVETYL